MQVELLAKLRSVNPVVMNISNFVTVQDVANGINAIGASPIMSEEIKEAAEMVQMSAAVVLNLGAFTDEALGHIRQTGLLANQLHKPLIVDPVAVGAVAYRKQTVADLFNVFHPDIIRGNAGEIAALADVAWQSKGVDAGEGHADPVAIVKKAAQKYQTIIVMTGETDYISDGKQVVTVENNTPLFQLHVGSGDMLSSIIGAFAGVTSDYFEAAQTAAVVFAVAGEQVADQLPTELPGTFAIKLLDQLHLVTPETVAAKGRIKQLEMD
ncbi:hydroxyethylthiazole kinase [Agrilactobacillus fermenti]|uniref:hydroxyethylthiazole kinase n=1 Tax=Agrilactobacillus fermenti TaxID=2586909 RepID=UPI001E34EE97|nr:hydroxyethylthiazole kinase [Agrilactobacillus fermenti]MCD2256869.1 hydroxyethylthiazole kinase [Agrilactobacillus fermenti]